MVPPHKFRLLLIILSCGHVLVNERPPRKDGGLLKISLPLTGGDITERADGKLFLLVLPDKIDRTPDRVYMGTASDIMQV
jgi:hypothetical protein